MTDRKQTVYTAMEQDDFLDKAFELYGIVHYRLSMVDQ